MKSIKTNKRFGGAAVIIIVLIVIIAIAIGAYYGYNYNTGKELQEKQTKLWSEAFTFFNQKQPERAYLSLVEARNTFGDKLDFYRKMAKGDNYLTKDEVDSLIVLICQSEAYDNLFKLESAKNWLDKAKSEINNLHDEETKNELNNFIASAEKADQICDKYREYIKDENLQDEKYQQLVKDSLKIGSEAIESGDYDYTIFEVRFLIACGKSFEEPVLIEEAENQLKDIVEARGEDEKTKLLWGLLRN